MLSFAYLCWYWRPLCLFWFCSVHLTLDGLDTNTRWRYWWTNIYRGCHHLSLPLARWTRGCGSWRYALRQTGFRPVLLFIWVSWTLRKQKNKIQVSLYNFVSLVVLNMCVRTNRSVIIACLSIKLIIYWTFGVSSEGFWYPVSMVQ